MNFGVSGEMIFLFLLVLILFGPKKMPEIGRQVARLLNEFRRASNEFRSQIESEVNSLDMGKADASSPRQQVLPSLQAPLGSLANRIFNPPSAERLEATEEAEAKAKSENDRVRTAAAESVATKASTEAAAGDAAVEVGTGLASVPRSAASKVAPDA